MTMDELSGETILKLFQDIKTDIRHDIAGLDTRFSTLMERMVTKDVFEAEQRHHSDQHRLMEEKIREETSRAADHRHRARLTRPDQPKITHVRATA